MKIFFVRTDIIFLNLRWFRFAKIEAEYPKKTFYKIIITQYTYNCSYLCQVDGFHLKIFPLLFSRLSKQNPSHVAFRIYALISSLL